MVQPVETWRTTDTPYRGPVCIWCDRTIRECGVDGRPCEARKHWRLQQAL